MCYLWTRPPTTEFEYQVPGTQPDDRTRVIGVYAYSEPGKVLLYQEACVVTGSEEFIRNYIRSLPHSPAKRMQISKMRFGELLDGLHSGAAYAFDRQSYGRFYNLARRSGIDDLDGFPQSESDAFDLMKVQFDTG